MGVQVVEQFLQIPLPLFISHYLLDNLIFLAFFLLIHEVSRVEGVLQAAHINRLPILIQRTETLAPHFIKYK